MKSIAYDAVYNQIVAQMEKGIIPWRKSWKSARPCNAKTNRPYNGINFFLLTSSGFEDNHWLTYKQLKELGGNVKKGEKSRQVVFWQILSKEEDGKKKSIPLLKYYNVFNVEQTEGVEISDEHDINNAINYDAEDVLKKYNGPKVIFGGDQPCYIPSLDIIKMPAIEKFNSSNEYYSTMFHEQAHGTSHKSRMDRELNVNFGSHNYSAEELLAEFTSAFLCNACGIDNTIEQSAAYLQSWMKAFQDNPSMIVHAASKAQKVADYILGINHQDAN